MSVFINGIEQLPEAARKVLSRIESSQKITFWVAIASLIVAIVAIFLGVFL